MARVEWSRLSGDETETVIAIMLCRRFPNAVRPKPSQGDGGVDLLVPVPDGSIIYQIKAFTGNLTGSQKNQIKKSWNALAKYSADAFINVVEWHLATPENPDEGAA